MLNPELKIKLNNNFFEFFRPLTVFQACLERKILIPRFCYHLALKISGNCRMCLVEEKSSIKPIASCAMPLTTGMSIYTNTEVVKRAREGVLEYLLINHPLDCPICDQGGECDLQDQSIVFGSDTGRFYEKKRSVKNKNFGFLIKTFFNRCIQCARCTRFLTDLAGTSEIQLLGRGFSTEISNYVNFFLKSELSGNIIDLCPVGALTSKPYSFKARVWELLRIYGYDIIDAFGSSIELNFKGLQIVRILPRPNKDLNEEWIHDKTRFFFDALYIQRLNNPFLKLYNKFFQLNWMSSLFLFKNHLIKKIHFFKKIKKLINLNYDFGAFIDMETAVFFKKFLNFFSIKAQKISSYLHDFRKNYLYDIDTFKNLSNVDNTSSLFLLNSNTRLESPLINLKLRKVSLFNVNFKAYSIGPLANLNFSNLHLGTRFTKKLFNFLNLINKKVFIESYNFSKKIIKNSNSISVNIGNLTQYELNLNSNYNIFSLFTIFLGQPEIINFSKKHSLLIALFHHIEDSFLTCLKAVSCVFFPVKFFYEKNSIFLNTFSQFFKINSHFSSYFLNKQEEWKILFIFSELLNFKKFNDYNFNYMIFNSFLPSLTKDLLFFSLIEPHQNYYSTSLKKSNIINFYKTNIISRMSETLSLCAKKFIPLNDFKFSI